MSDVNSDRVRAEGDPVADTVGTSLDHLIGSWSDAEAAEIERALKHFETIDDAMWESCSTRTRTGAPTPPPASPHPRENPCVS